MEVALEIPLLQRNKGNVEHVGILAMISKPAYKI
jgi:hypothetical protein